MAKGAMAMSEQERGSREACRRYAPTLAVLEDSGADPEARRAALDHLATCARCQADQRAYARLDTDLRHTFSPTSPAVASPLRTSDLLAAIGATSEPAAMPHWAARPTRAAIRSVIYLGDFEGGFERMSETPEPQERGGDKAAPDRTQDRKMAAIPSLRPAPQRIGQRAWTVGFSATAVAVALIVIAVTLFASRPHSGVAQTAAHVSATQTAGAHGAAGTAAGGPIVAISMDSPTDGWAIGDATGQQAGPVQTSVVALYHYNGSQWRLSQQIQGFPTYMGTGANPSTLKMLSATDGWAFGGSGHVLHYDGTAWRSVTISPAGGEQVLQLLALDMVSPTQGLAAARLGTSSPQGALGFLRFDGQQWSVEQGIISSLPGLDMNTLTITGISATPGGDVWAVGWAYAFASQSASQTSVPQVGLIFHRANGVWRLASELNQPTASVQIIPRDLLMLGPDTGWIVGDTDQTTTATEIGGATTTLTTTHALLLHYDGARWTQVSAPFATPTTSDRLQGIVATGPDSIWVTVQSNASAVLSSGVQFSGDFLHYDGTTWSEVTPSPTLKGVTSAWITAASPALDGTLWAVGGAELVQNQHGSVGPFFCLYANGAWGVVTPVVSGK
jgi:hypothetical protein